MTSKRIRMVDVAAAAGVSQTTASFVLNGRESGIPEETRQRVLKAARSLDYRPNATARALATGRTHRISVVANHPENFMRDSYHTETLTHIIANAPDYDYDLLLHASHYKDAQALRNSLLSGVSDGALLIGADLELTRLLLEEDFPVVCISYSVPHPACYFVDCDNESGGYLAARHLIGLGHRQIAFLHPGEDFSWGRERLQGARRAVAEAGLPLQSLYAYDWSVMARCAGYRCWTEENISATIKTILEHRPLPTALIASDEVWGRWLTERLPGLGFYIPGDLALVSFNSTETSTHSRPPMTSVYQPLDRIAAAGLEMLVGLIEKRPELPRCQRFPMRLDIRESCGTR